MSVHRLPVDYDGHRAKIITEPDEIRQLREQTTPIPGRPGWRIDGDGREWYSASWLEKTR